ncbi:Coenzyme F420 hydrogenase/dehydrogenase, beta subunit C-terminal domain [Sanguibacter suaedae]|uniref:Coenzyme F420 hydrogenase/dehydrogenase, beta subunit C-terminal domain n=1 Tax=Sanguibacter suaedae TaxID=2795737 RepID=A0A934IFT2_9MICO|nr:Coenzyme F420 hydrogenase/dehydrogenase, beta subunit C-terminal domain [Sanguibacter suaedae]MBI9116199.1 Coenzyme F420 hydrogenase/dehydrogenase, beta subunit C-terminal domain [Sanguibacter suaedae]
MTAPDRRTTALERAVARVVDNDNCSGCGVCPLVSDRITMGLDDAGFLRPRVDASPIVPRDDDQDAQEAELFLSTCPGRAIRAPRSAAGTTHPIFGRSVEVWQGAASDDEVREAGSSGGVLTALAAWLVTSGRAAEVRGSASGTATPTRTVPVRITTREEALASAGSRYAPVSNTLAAGEDTPMVCKPCEASGTRRYFRATGREQESPILLSFFCAGTPSQSATDALCEELGIPAEDVASLRYRGNGWPGNFTITSHDGETRTKSYQQSWGQRLGRALQTRCKLCVDGTGEDADVAVGDFWSADERGFPVFDDAEGNSVIIARTERGAALVQGAIAAGVLTVSPVDLDEVARIQPLQNARRRTLAGRLAGRFAAGKAVPRYTGYGLVGHMIWNIPASAKAAIGMFTRTTGLRR